MRDPSHPGAESSAPGERGDPHFEVSLWPHRSLTETGLRWLIIGSCAAYAIPILAFFGTTAMLVLAALAAFHVWLLWFFIRRNTRALSLSETLRLWPDLITVERRDPRGRVRHWQANPYWVRLTLHKNARPENYLTLKGGGREIELGAFLSPDERVTLKEEIEREIRLLRPG
ncbi:MAG: DUF2244 domain-containing protein [Pseudomonadota bacterium]